jgi:two-component system chemotaxis sensor kinase CheA
MTLRVPLTLTIIPALTVSIGKQHFAIPRSAIEEIVRANGSSVTLETIGGQGSRPSAAAASRSRAGRRSGPASTMRDEERTLVVLRPQAATSMRWPSTRSMTMRSWW